MTFAVMIWFRDTHAEDPRDVLGWHIKALIDNRKHH